MRCGLDFVRAAILLSKFAASGKVQAKKNLGLMQMQCKDVYVAYVSMGTNPAKLLQNSPLRIKARYGKVYSP